MKKKQTDLISSDLKEKKYLIIRYFKVLIDVKLLLLLLVIISIFITVILTLNLFLNKLIYDELFKKLDKQLLYEILISLSCLYLLINIFEILKNIITIRIKQSILHKLRKNIVNEIIGYQYEYFFRKNSGKFVKSIIDDIEIIATSLTNICTGLTNFILITLWLILLFIFAKWLFTIFIIIFSCVIIWAVIWKIPLWKKDNQLGESYLELFKIFWEIIPGIKTIKFELLNNYIIKMILNLLTKMKKIVFEIVFLSINSSILYTISPWIIFCFIFYFGSSELQKGNITIGILIIYFFLIWPLYGPMYEIINAFISYHDFLIASKRLNNYRDGKKEIEGSINLINFKESLVFKNITYKHQNSFFKLKNINLSIKKGQNVALIGKTGSGKTTIINLLLRLFDSDSGEILIDGININDFTLSSLRNNITLVSQDISMYYGNLRDNIDIKNNMNDKEILDLINKLNLKLLLEKLPNGLDSEVSENNFSGGELQRLGIAKALSMKSKFFIFDEVTSSLDPRNQNRIIDIIYNLGKDITTITITHNISVLTKMDKLLLLKNGKLKEIDNTNKILNKRMINRIIQHEI